MVAVRWGRKGLRSQRRKYSRIAYKPPSSKVVSHVESVLNKRDVTGAEVKPFADGSRYSMKKVMLIATLTMAPGELVNYLIVKSNSPIANWSSSFSNPSLMVKESVQDTVTIVGGGKLESSGTAGKDVTKSFRKFVKLGSGISQTQHLYLIIYSSDAMKITLETRMYIDV
ncbi:coat protein [Subterranean clover stunt virus]|uniref:Capsid protein n=3 Tax=Subterranean clover stunt virus TaxID=36772 RepID=CAPSD_SCSVF|nr:coat protein [Subterranean clover stunt virus]YP_010839893.1 capsid protein [Subterranean clover stunt virus]Q87012.1 RecName: Full=Capsid protein; Short=CP; AltName: Full=Coat protein [Subterranean clover stunt virus (strain F)]AAA68021.1 coat protein [Subterranean clover stunt virus]AXG50857.1 CP [Subterranean clover stunt virus]QBC74511.1 capsid protein [Subterranean clover stunt virus]